jgi:hypothetical protein
MKRFAGLLSFLLAVVIGVGFVQAKPKGATPPKDPTQKKSAESIVGTVLKVDGQNINLQTHGKNSGEVTVPTDAKTEFEVNGAKSTLEKIKPGMQVVVTPNTGIAQKVVVSEEGKKKAKDKKKKDAGAAAAGGGVSTPPKSDK